MHTFLHKARCGLLSPNKCKVDTIPSHHSSDTNTSKSMHIACSACKQPLRLSTILQLTTLETKSTRNSASKRKVTNLFKPLNRPGKLKKSLPATLFSMKKKKKCLKKRTTLSSQMEVGSAQSAKTTTSKVEESATDVKRLRPMKTSMENQNTC